MTFILGVLLVASKYSYGTNKKGLELTELQMFTTPHTHIKVYSSLKTNLIKKHQPIINHYVVYDTVHSELCRIIGPINDYTSCLIAARFFCQLHFKPITITPIKELTPFNVNPRTDIISIDNDSTIDIDDAFSFSNNELCIYISDVSAVIDVDKTPTIFSTLYSPTERYDMLSFKAVEQCSLTQQCVRPVVTLKLHLCDTLTESFSTEFIVVNKNLTYDYVDTSGICNHIIDWVNGLLNTPVNDTCASIATYFSNKQKPALINDSHDLIEFCMLYYNQAVGRHASNIVYKTQLPNSTSIYALTPDFHTTLCISHYCHASSPIRRWIDQYNQYQLKRLLNDTMTEWMIDPSIVTMLNKWDQSNKQLTTIWNSLAFAFNNTETVTMMRVHNIEYDTRKIVFELDRKRYVFYVNHIISMDTIPFKVNDIIQVKLGSHLMTNNIQRKMLCYPTVLAELFESD